MHMKKTIELVTNVLLVDKMIEEDYETTSELTKEDKENIHDRALSIAKKMIEMRIK